MSFALKHPFGIIQAGASAFLLGIKVANRWMQNDRVERRRNAVRSHDGFEARTKEEV